MKMMKRKKRKQRRRRRELMMKLFQLTLQVLVWSFEN